MPPLPSLVTSLLNLFLNMFFRSRLLISQIVAIVSIFAGKQVVELIWLWWIIYCLPLRNASQGILRKELKFQFFLFSTLFSMLRVLEQGSQPGIFQVMKIGLGRIALQSTLPHFCANSCREEDCCVNRPSPATVGCVWWQVPVSTALWRPGKEDCKLTSHLVYIMSSMLACLRNRF